MILVIGGSGSGKSEYAEKLAVSRAGKFSVSCADEDNKCVGLVYLATMQAFDDESKERIARHRKMRAGKGFETVEAAKLSEVDKDNFRDKVVLLEDLPNLLANYMYSENQDGSVADNQELNEPKESIKNNRNDIKITILEEILEVAKKCAELIIVSGNIFDDCADFDEETVKYMDNLSFINSGLANQADKVYEVVAGICLER